jgi:alpha-tubulin suppressor-like RCC1 family protein
MPTLLAPGRFGVAPSTAGALFSWGEGGNGELGSGATTDRSSPVQVGALTDWQKLACGQKHILAIKTDGTLWAWGLNTVGQLGDGSTTTRSSPVQIGADTDWATIAANGTLAGGAEFSAAIKTGGTLWTWGENGSGQLGVGNTTDRSSPTQVGALTTWSKVACSGKAMFAIKTDGTLWHWGGSAYTVGPATSSPVQVGALTNWASIAAGNEHVLAVKTDGTLWAWGLNSSGAVGDGTTTTRTSPVQIGALTTWSKVAAGGAMYSYNFGNSFAIKTDGTLWSWGEGSSGALGSGATTDRSSPVQVGALTDWDQITVRHETVLATKTGGTLWAWGGNGVGQLGDGTTTSKSSPVQIGALTNWSGQLAASQAASLAVTE